jgi:Rrf2 family iron-sulfur cluster assembly transcriptional regulator
MAGMVMKISSKARYAIQSMFQLALSDRGRPVTLAEITEEQGISSSYLEQLLGQLRKAGLVEGLRGPGGGYRLSRHGSQINIAEILAAVNGETDAAPKGEHSQFDQMWQVLCEQINGYLGSLSLTQFTEQEEVQRILHTQRLLRDREALSNPSKISKSG